MSVEALTVERHKTGYVPVEAATLAALNRCEFNLYRADRDGRFVLFRERSVSLTRDDLRQIAASNIGTLYIGFGDRDAFVAALHDQLANGDDLPPIERCRLLKEATRTAYESAMRTTNVVEILKISDKLAQQLTDGLCSQDFLFGDMFDLVARDLSAFTHATNVSTYSLMLAARLGITSKKELIEIASGGLLHDIGKGQIPPRILNKPGQLTPEERELMRQHPKLGFEALCREPRISWGPLMMVYQHHERLDGTGYPVCLLADDIHPWGMVCAVADVFDAMTVDRPYRKALPVDQAVRFLKERGGRSFDKEIVKCLCSVIPSR